MATSSTPLRADCPAPDAGDAGHRSLPRIGLLAPEVCTRGGIQTFMLRIAEVIGATVAEGKAAAAHCISLNDSSESLSRHPAIPKNVAVWGANRSKAKLFAHALTTQPRIDTLFVGHVGMAPLALMLKALGRVRDYYVILHGIDAWKRVPYLDRRALLGATRIIATTKFTAQECGRHNQIAASRFQIIPLCADEQSITPTPGFRLNGEFKLLCVARQASTERYKGFEQTLQALALLSKLHPGVHLNLVGQGDDQERLKNVAAELGISSQVTFWGPLSDEDLAAAYESCDVFVMPSKKEGFGIVFLEAMRRGKPCIGGNHGGTPDVIEHGRSGFLVSYGDAATLANQIRMLVEDIKKRQSMGKRASELVSSKFSLSRFQAQYRDLAAQPSKHG
jgi:phosphatidyl-myo-inositol dimannoside synthase